MPEVLEDCDVFLAEAEDCVLIRLRTTTGTGWDHYEEGEVNEYCLEAGHLDNVDVMRDKCDTNYGVNDDAEHALEIEDWILEIQADCGVTAVPDISSTAVDPFPTGDACVVREDIQDWMYDAEADALEVDADNSRARLAPPQGPPLERAVSGKFRFNPTTGVFSVGRANVQNTTFGGHTYYDPSLVVLESFTVNRDQNGDFSEAHVPFTLEAWVDNENMCSFWPTETTGTVTGNIGSTSWSMDYAAQSSFGYVTVHLEGEVL